MGCDIHTFIERREGAEWKLVPDAPEINWRSYSLFAVLAGVRNRYEIEPIDEPRGLPSDRSPELREQDDAWGWNGHTHSYFTVAELLAFDWSRLAYTEDDNSGFTYGDMAGDFYTKTLPSLQAIGHPEDVRMVFWFDN